MKLLLVLGSVLVACLAVDLTHEEWNNFKLKHGKTYSSPSEEQRRLEIFLENKQKIAEHNEKFERGEVSFKMGVNKFADLSHQEYMQQFKMISSPHPRIERQALQFPMIDTDLPSSIDWREKGAVTPVGDHGSCMSGWAFSAAGAIEAQQFLKSGKLVPLSVQNIIDCVDTLYGCQGGNMGVAYEYFVNNGNGVDTAASYPYEGKTGACRFDPQNVGATLTNFTVFYPGGFNETALHIEVATLGPISVPMNSSPQSFQLYESGIYDEEGCTQYYLDHGVLVVGYGTENGTDYWIVKNSWGESWGENGFFRLARNKNNMCGIADLPSFPIV